MNNYICSNAKNCTAVCGTKAFYNHKIPHEQNCDCGESECSNYHIKVKCVPVKKEETMDSIFPKQMTVKKYDKSKIFTMFVVIPVVSGVLWCLTITGACKLIDIVKNIAK